jgi:hypothetical protein
MGALGNGSIDGASSNTQVLNILPDWQISEDAVSKDLVFQVTNGTAFSPRLTVPYLNA